MNPDLSQLRDIHLPAPISWWPPAIGWWLLLLLLIVLIAMAYWFYRRRHKQQWRRDALTELQHLQQQQLSTKELVTALSMLLRRVAITCFPREEAASLTGEKWLAFLDQTLDAKRSTKLPLPFGGEGGGEGVNKEISFQKYGRVLITAPYSATVDADAKELCALCERWITGVAR
jgi:cbb3-type cytochrome oxidase subunit 3